MEIFVANNEWRIHVTEEMPVKEGENGPLEILGPNSRLVKNSNNSHSTQLPLKKTLLDCDNRVNVYETFNPLIVDIIPDSSTDSITLAPPSVLVTIRLEGVSTSIKRLAIISNSKRQELYLLNGNSNEEYVRTIEGSRLNEHHSGFVDSISGDGIGTFDKVRLKVKLN